jgi:hypothetical protein
MITIDEILFSDYSIVLQAGDEQYLMVNGVNSTLVVSVKILDVGGKCIIQSSIASSEFLKEPSTTHADCNFEFIKVNGVSLPEVTIDVLSARGTSPNILYIKNSSMINERVWISIRGNR